MQTPDVVVIFGLMLRENRRNIDDPVLGNTGALVEIALKPSLPLRRGLGEDDIIPA